jgi:hypothetical protein
VTAPARLAGEVLLVHETLNQARENRKAWLYNPGQRRVRRAPNVAHDNPRTASDGLATSDQLDIFNGSPERYNWNLVGRKEVLVPYNSYKLHSKELKYRDILKPLHINQEHARYELHRMWVVDAVAEGGHAPRLQAADLLHRRGLLAGDGRGLLRQSGPDLARAGSALDQLLRRADVLDDARADHGPAVRPVSRHRPEQRGARRRTTSARTTRRPTSARRRCAAPASADRQGAGVPGAPPPGMA